MGFKWCFDPIVVIFFEMKFFSFQKNLQVLDQSTLVIFLTFLKKFTSVRSSVGSVQTL